eukprot:CAMPEP_0194296522 /NCGR_PEP_ID=MMETSP0169-20130528/56380_1 /TAXON_ID=218684 /ORGANISM="Corethron pennatum, Strain L29A3" /LENGTH=79 /DNA_ID=CAMNT_0039046015 /DNA_START=95 /DNA_END=331 /DNA_ORIENTATION=+
MRRKKSVEQSSRGSAVAHPVVSEPSHYPRQREEGFHPALCQMGVEHRIQERNQRKDRETDGKDQVGEVAFYEIPQVRPR